jgi:phosphoribosylformimino-5-aminoimidazole carboxamide ribonucleotide (ProFAR) isomerase
VAASIVRWKLSIAVIRAGGIAESEDIGKTEQVGGMIDRFKGVANGE